MARSNTPFHVPSGLHGLTTQYVQQCEVTVNLYPPAPFSAYNSCLDSGHLHISYGLWYMAVQYALLNKCNNHRILLRYFWLVSKTHIWGREIVQILMPISQLVMKTTTRVCWCCSFRVFVCLFICFGVFCARIELGLPTAKQALWPLSCA